MWARRRLVKSNLGLKLPDLPKVLIDGNRAYLVKLSGTEPVNWTVTGRPLLEPYRWATDTWSLTGFQ